MSSRPRLVAEGSPIPATDTGSQNERDASSVGATHHRPPPHVAPHVSHANPPLHPQQALQQPRYQSHVHGNRRYNHGHHGSNRHHESHGRGTVATHITIGGGSTTSQQQPTSYQQHGTGGAQHQQLRTNSSTASPLSTNMQLGDTQSHRAVHTPSSLSAAAGPNVGAQPPHRSSRPTQLHTHLVIGGGQEPQRENTLSSQFCATGNSYTAQEREHSQGHWHDSSINHPARTSNDGGAKFGGVYPHRLVIGGYTGHVSAGMSPYGNTSGVGHQPSVSHMPASGQSELASEDYDYDLLGGIPDHHLSHVIGSEHLQNSTQQDTTERMEVEDIIPLPPLIVIDGANVAYAYGKAKSGANIVTSNHSDSISGVGRTYSRQGSSCGTTGRSSQADAKGILITCNYFMNAGCRVQVVLPAPWLQTKSQRRNGNDGSSNYDADEALPHMSEMTPQLEVLHGLRDQCLLCAAPANDDDDSYSIMLARRENARAARRRGGGQAGSKNTNDDNKVKSILEQGGGFVLSNDQFRDAQSRDRTSSTPTGLDEWLEGKKKGSRLQDRIHKIPGRISYSFGDVGSMDQYGDREWDLIPNPRHPLVEEIEQANRARELSLA